MSKLIFSRRFSMAHRLIHGPSEKCRTPHGHNEIVRVTLGVISPGERLDGQENMHISFHQAKKTWHHFIDNHIDHALQLAHDDPLLSWFATYEPKRLQHIVVTPGDPTTELMACLLMHKLNCFLKAENQNVSCSDILIEETPTNSVSFSGNPKNAIPHTKKDKSFWWQRPDMSISNYGYHGV